MKIFYPLRRFLLLVLTPLAVIILVGLAAIFLWPELVINHKSLEVLSKIGSKQGYLVQWSSLDFKHKRVNLLKRKISVRSKDLCISFNEPKLAGCFENFEASFVISFQGFHLQLTDLGPVKIHSRQFALTLPPSSVSDQVQEKSESSSAWVQYMPSWLLDADIHQVDIKVEAWKLVSQDSKNISGDLTIDGSDSTKNSQITLKVVSKVNLADGAKVSFNADFSKELEKKSSEKSNSRSAVTLSQAVTGNYHIQAIYVNRAQKNSVKALVQVTGQLHEGGFTAQVDGVGENFHPVFKKVNITECKLIAETPGWSISQNPGGAQFKANCHLKAGLANIQKLTPVDFRIKDFEAVIKAELKAPQIFPDAKSKIQGFVNVEIPNIHNPYFALDGHVQADFNGTSKDFPQEIKLNSGSLLNFKIPHFEKLVALTEKTRFAVPAPFHALKGEVELSVKGQGDYGAWEFPIQLNTNLHSKQQKLKVEGKGVFALAILKSKICPSLKIDAELTDVKVLLPPLDFSEIPQLTADPRIQLDGPVETSTFHYRVHLFSPSKNPAQVISNLGKNPIPISIDLFLSDQTPLSGKIEIQSFPANLFHRDATVNFFNITLADPIKNSEINGSLQVKYTDYLIQLKIMSTVEKPQIKWSSDPPTLSEIQIIAALLFGKPLEDLDTEQLNSATNMEAALERLAINLASLYFLASTPIQSIGYDPVKKELSAKIRLGENTSLNLGTDMNDLKTVGLRRRLGKRWTIETDVNSPMDKTSRGISTMIEWNYRH